MLPQEYHEEACKLFCVWLRRLEERDRKNGYRPPLANEKGHENPATGYTHRVTDTPSLSSVSSRQHTGTEKNVSAEMQQDKSFAIKCGWKDEKNSIILDTRDLGVSGQLRMEERLAFRDMLRRMQGRDGFQKIGAVIARDVSRLFRNKWGDEPGKFMEICHAHNVLVVTADFVYDFHINWHIDKFKRQQLTNGLHCR